MYDEHFGLSEPPFKITPDTRLFYTGGSRGAILDAIVYAITSGEGIIKVVGEVGSGKTMLCRMLEVRLPESVEVVYLANPSLSPDNILHAIAFEMRLPVEANANRLQVMQALQEYLLEKHANNRQVVMFVEEAQSMPLETLEEIRLLSNLETQRAKLLQIILFGQPELEPNLSEPHIRQLRERITHSFDLPPFGRQETREYLDFRMRAAGYRGPQVFSRGAVRALARASKGLVRRTNILADKSLLAAYAAGVHLISGRHVKVAVKDSEFGRPARKRKPLVGLAVAAGVTVPLVAGGVYLAAGGYLSGMTNTPPDYATSPAPASGRQNLKGGYDRTFPPSLDVGEKRNAMARPPVQRGVALQPAGGLISAENKIGKSRLEEESRGGRRAAAKVASETLSRKEDAQWKGAALEVPLPVEIKYPKVSESAVAGKSGEPDASTVTNGSEDGADDVVALASVTRSEDRIQRTGTASDERPVAKKTAVQPGDQSSLQAGAPAPPETTMAIAPEARNFRPVSGNPRQDETKDQSFLEWRLEETRKWLANADGNRFSIQLMLVNANRAGKLEENLRHGGLGTELDNIYVYRTRIRGTDLISILLGEYAAYGEARRRLKDLPPAMQRARPFIRNVSDIQAINRLLVTGG